MLEILAIWFLASKIGGIVKEKGHKRGGYILLTVLLWILGEIVGVIVGTVLSVELGLSQCLVYLFALAGAACGGGFVYWLATRLPQRNPPLTPAGAAPLGDASTVPPAVLDDPQMSIGLEEAEEPGRAEEIERAAEVLEQNIDDPSS